jgi:hypothetical protein
MGICFNVAKKSQNKTEKTEMVHTVVENVPVMFSGSRTTFQIRKFICFYSKKWPQNQKKK